MKSESRKQAKTFFYRLLIFCLIVLVADQAIGYLLKKLYFKQKSGSPYKTTYTLEKVTAPVLIIGSSKAEHQYIPDVFEDSLKLGCFNAGVSGNHIFFYDAILKGVLKRYTPKIIVLDLINNELEKNPESYSHLSVLLPYYATHPEIRPTILLKGPYEQIKLLSAIYPYNSSIISSVIGVLDLHHKQLNIIKNKGFNDDYKTVVDRAKPVVSYGNIIDTVCVNTLQSFIKTCKAKNIKVFIFIAPCYARYTDQSKSTAIAKAIAGRYRVPLWDYSQDPAFVNNTSLFHDQFHLNVNGALIYSEMVAQKVKVNLINY